jgi:hypothetical protein
MITTVGPHVSAGRWEKGLGQGFVNKILKHLALK